MRNYIIQANFFMTNSVQAVSNATKLLGMVLSKLI